MPIGPVSLRLDRELTKLKSALPILKYCRGDAFSTDHWSEFLQSIGLSRNISVEQLTFGHLLDSIDAILTNGEAIKVRHFRQVLVTFSHITNRHLCVYYRLGAVVSRASRSIHSSSVTRARHLGHECHFQTDSVPRFQWSDCTAG